MHFEFIFVYGVKDCSNFVLFCFFTCSCPVVPALFIEKPAFSLLYNLVSLVVDELTIGGFITGLSALFH